MNISLSVIVPLYNVELYINECLDSLLDQGLDLNDYEIIVVNDGSTDKSPEIVEKYRDKYKNIKIINQKNEGLSAARNVGIQAACGEYICFVDSDDFLVRNRMFSLVKVARSNDVEILTYDILGGKYTEVLCKSQNIKVIVDRSQKVQSGVEYIAEHNYNNGVWYYLIKREFLLKTKLLFEVGRKCEDGMFTMELFLRANSILHVNTPVYCYINRENSIITTRNAEHQRVMIDDFLYAIFHITTIISENKKKMSIKCYRRCVCRRDSYIFFLLIRMIEAKLPRKERSIILDKLKSVGLYPFKPLDLDYPTLKIRLLCRLLNNSVIYNLMFFLYHIKN